MGILDRLMGSDQNVEATIRDYVAAQLSLIKSMGLMGFQAPVSLNWENRCSVVDVLVDPEYETNAGAYILGLFDYLGQQKGLSETVILATAKSALKKGFGISSDVAERIINNGIKASQSEDGRKILRAGAEAMASCAPGNVLSLFKGDFERILLWGGNGVSQRE